MRRRAVEIEVVFLDIFAVIALAVRQAEEAFLQDWVATVPQGQCKTKLLFVVGDTGQSIFTPAIRTRTRLIMREIIPGVSIGAVVLAHRAPLPFAEIWPPLLPRHTFFACNIQSLLLGDLNVSQWR